jgi:hypothetical protein
MSTQEIDNEKKYNACHHWKHFARFWALVLGSFGQVHKSHLIIPSDESISGVDVAVK